GVTAPCRTALEPILPPPDPALVKKIQVLVGPARAGAIVERQPARLAAVAEELGRPSGAEVVCECEQVTAGEVLAVARSLPRPSLSDVRRRTRLGMGTCQGAFCGYRTALLLAETGVVDPSQAPGMMLQFQAERWRGVSAALPGPEMRGAELTYAMYAGLFGGPMQGGDNHG
ncbi:MAG TPA: (2Fe-2S)-binding protein, partial [Symbiobacteriaceae bacterium]|nr:(2Fe-2S)-binding protein [Symbiobacteriaceae bacterium]